MWCRVWYLVVSIPDICLLPYSARTYVVFLGPVRCFLKKAYDYYILFLGSMVMTKNVVGSQRIVADTAMTSSIWRLSKA